MSIAIIPARGGSKRIPRKNIKEFCGKPMIDWSIEAARQSQCFERIIVSTDDAEIAHIAQQNGAEVPFMRPEALADDHAGTQAVIAHAVEALALDGSTPVCCIYATAPFLVPQDLQRGLQTLQTSDADFVFAATSYAFPIQRAIRIDDAGRVRMFQPEYYASRSQDLESAWHDAGQFYWGTAEAWQANGPLFSRAAAVILPRHRVQDIDTPEDWQRAEWMFRAWKEQGAGK